MKKGKDEEKMNNDFLKGEKETNQSDQLDKVRCSDALRVFEISSTTTFSAQN